MIILSCFLQGCVEIDDQVEALLHLANTTNYIDTKRIAIHGWSYGMWEYSLLNSMLHKL